MRPPSLFRSVLLLLWPVLASASSSPEYLPHLVPRGLSDASSCASLASQITIPDVTVQFTQYVTAGTNISVGYGGAYNTSTCAYTGQVVTADLCRVAMYVATSNRSGITLEAWLPTNWTGRFLSKWELVERQK